MIEIKAKLITGRDMVNRAMRATMGKQGDCGPVSDSTLYHLLRAKHSPIREMTFWYDIIAPERVHTHLVRHEGWGKYVASSRPDLSYCKSIEDGHRMFSLKIDALKLIHLMGQRLCKRAWHETIYVVEAMREETIKLEPVMQYVMVRPCVWMGFCPEQRPNKPACGYNKTLQCARERESLMSDWPDIYKENK